MVVGVIGILTVFSFLSLQTCQKTLLQLDHEYKELEGVIQKSNDLSILEEDVSCRNHIIFLSYLIFV